MKTDTDKRYRKWFCFLIAALAVYTVKNIFIGADADEGYGIVLGYRLVKGDRLLLEMWEPHQTSGIFTALLMKPFLWLTGNNNFLNLYLRVVYFVLHGAIACCCYGTLRTCVTGLGQKEAALAAMIFYVTSPKCIYVPEYSNLHVWFFALFCLSMMRYYCAPSPQRGKRAMLAAAGAFLCCDLFAYPSMALLFPVCLIFIFRFRIKRSSRNGTEEQPVLPSSGNKGKPVKEAFMECLVFLLPGLAAGLAFAGYVMSYMTVPQVLQVIPYILGDGTHRITFRQKILIWAESYGETGLTLAVCSVCALILVCGWSAITRRRALTRWSPLTGRSALTKWRGNRADESLCGHGVEASDRSRDNGFVFRFFAALFLVLLAYQFYCWFTSDFNAGYPQTLYSAVTLMGIWCCFRSGKEEKTGLCLILVSWLNYFAVSVLSNWEPVHLHPYLCMGTIGGILCIKACLKKYGTGKGERVLRILCGLFILGNVFGYCYLIIGGEELHSSIFTIGGINREGVRKGILVSYMSAYRYNANQEIWAEAVPNGSTLLYLGPSQDVYMLGECTIASPSTISTPTYDERMLAYWEMNPDRCPDVVAVESWYGDIRIFGQESFMGQWLEEYCGDWEMTDYPYVRVYRR